MSDELDKIIVNKTRYIELKTMLSELTKSYENLPREAMVAPVTNYDLHGVLLLLTSLVNSLSDCIGLVD